MSNAQVNFDTKIDLGDGNPITVRTMHILLANLVSKLDVVSMLQDVSRQQLEVTRKFSDTLSIREQEIVKSTARAMRDLVQENVALKRQNAKLRDQLSDLRLRVPKSTRVLPVNLRGMTEDQILQLPIEELMLGARITNSLHGEGILYVHELAKLSEENLSSIINLGRKGRLEIKDRLSALKLITPK